MRQLGLAHFVFPGAEHSRLVHVLGAAHLAIRFGKQLQLSTRDFLAPDLQPTEEAIRDLAVAALCHDLGHGPLSHGWEHYVVGDDFDRNKWLDALGLTTCRDQLLGAKWHELVTHGLLRWKEGQLHKSLEQHEAGLSERISHMLLGNYHLEYLPLLLSSDVDIDRCDYLLRDALQAGVAYGRYDLNWLVSTCTVGYSSDRRRYVVGFDLGKAPSVVEQILVARRALHATVYYHKTVRAAELLMVGLFLKRLKKVFPDGGGDLPKIYLTDAFQKLLRGEVLQPHEILTMDDYSLWVLIDQVAQSNKMDSVAQDIAQRLLARKLMKRVECAPDKLESFFNRKEAYAEFEKAIRPFCPGESEYYYHLSRLSFSTLHKEESKRAFFVDMKNASKSATAITRHRLIRPFEEETPIPTRLYTISEASRAAEKILGA